MQPLSEQEIERRVRVTAEFGDWWFDDYQQQPAKKADAREIAATGIFIVGFAAFIVWVAVMWVAGDPSAVAVGP